MRVLITRLVTVACIAALAVACGRDNGLPGDLTDHLAANGIPVRVLESSAPWSSRGGRVLIEADPGVEQKIIDVFGLSPVDRTDPQFDFILDRIDAEPQALWGAAGRPANLRLADGGQFEYLYLLKTATGRTWLFAEYAYG